MEGEMKGGCLLFLRGYHQLDVERFKQRTPCCTTLQKCVGGVVVD